MRFVHRDATIADLPRIVEIYNFAVATRESSCDIEPITVAAREEWFAKLGTYFLDQAIRHAPSLGIEVLAVTIFASNQPSIRLLERNIR
jgi:L-amino acid N-acyltransferase YncA